MKDAFVVGGKKSTSESLYVGSFYDTPGIDSMPDSYVKIASLPKKVSHLVKNVKMNCL